MTIVRKWIAALLSAVLLLGIIVPVAAAETEDVFVSVIVELSGAAVMEVEEFANAYAADSVGFSMSSTAAAYRSQLEAEQTAVQQAIAEAVDQVLFRYSYTNLLNGFNAWVRYDDLDAIRAIDGVAAVYPAQQYDVSDLVVEQGEFVPLETYAIDNDVQLQGSLEQVGAPEAWENGYTGAGKVAAVFDSGLYAGNQLFQYYDLEALQAQYPELNLDTDVNGGTVRTAEGIRQILLDNQNTMNLFQSQWEDWFHSWEGMYPVPLPSGFGENVTESVENLDFFTSEKVPFNVDYANGDFNTWTEHDDQETVEAYEDISNHGTHVAGIVAGNAGPSESQLAVKGTAYDAQLFFFKVFKEQDEVGQEGDEDVFAALDDAVTLGVNVFNLSLGIPNGFTTYNGLAQSGYQRVYNSARNAGISIAVSAGNDDRDARTGSLVNARTVQLPNNYTIGGTGSMFAPFSVASAENSYYPAYNTTNAPKTTARFVTKGEDGAEADVLTIANLTDNNGPYSVGEILTEQYELVWAGTWADVLAAEEDAYAGKVAVVQLEYWGDDVYEDAIAKGAVAAIAVNSSTSQRALTTSHLRTGLTFGAIAKRHAATLQTAMEAQSVHVSFTTKENDGNNKDEKSIRDAGPSSFTSWGVTEGLRLKPDIMAPGSNIISAGVGHPHAMTWMNGTSMASPSVAGCMLLVQQYVDKLIAADGLLDGQLQAGTLEYATLVDNLIGSTALVYQPYSGSSGALMRDDETGRLNRYFSPRRQGAGMIQVDKATSTRVYLTSAMEVGYNQYTGESQRPKLELGEVGMAQTFTMTLQAVNFDTEPHSFRVETVMQTDAVEKDGDGRYSIKASVSSGADVEPVEAAITVLSVEGGTLTAESANTNRYVTGSSPAIVEVPAQSKAAITLQVTLPDMTAFDAIFTNGMFLEGFVFLEDTTAQMDLSLPYLAFRGDWDAAPVFDSITGYEDRTLSDPMYHADTLRSHVILDGEVYDMVLGSNQYELGMAPPEITDKNANREYYKELRYYLDTMRKKGSLSADFAAISPNGDGQADDVFAGVALLRNAKVLGVQILDESGRLVKDLGYEFEYFKAHQADLNNAHRIQTTAYDRFGHGLQWDGTDAQGRPVADGRYYYKLTAVTEADYLDLLNEPEIRTELNAFVTSLERTDSLVNGSQLPSISEKVQQLTDSRVRELLRHSVHTKTMAVQVDTAAPSFTGTIEGTAWTLEGTDTGSGIQAAMLYYDGVQVGDPVLVNSHTAAVTFDLSGLGDYDVSKLAVQAVDFAMNEGGFSYSRYDVNCDGVVDQLDMTRAQRYYLKQNPRCDLDGDGWVRISDFILIMLNYTA